MIECPECGSHVRGSKCKCGWEVPQAKAERKFNDPQYGQCDWTAEGRCHYPGVFGHGKDGPYYCRGHENCTDPLLGSQIVEKSRRDIPRPDYSFAARKAYSDANLRRDMEAWNSRYEGKVAA